jgi:hypothetical protein
MCIFDRHAEDMNWNKKTIAGTTIHDAIKDRYDREYLIKLVAAGKAIRQFESMKREEADQK